MVIMKTPPKTLKSKSQISDFYAKTLARVLGSKNEAEIYTYDASCETHFGFCCDIDEQTSQALARLPFRTSTTTLRAKFEIYGEVVEAKIPWDPISNRSKGYGFIEYATEEAAGVALKKLNGKIIAGWVIGVVAAESDPPRYKKSRPKLVGRGHPNAVESDPPRYKKNRPKLVGRGHPNAVSRSSRRPKF